MTKTMLIDAAHREEVRVCVLENGKVEDFDFESATRKPLRGNIYLARITRVEPSLQAAFVEYGGNRHGFLAFNEIHPDYYQIPVSDRRLLQEAEAEEAALAAELELEHRGDDDALDLDPADDEDAEFDGDARHSSTSADASEDEPDPDQADASRDDSADDDSDGDPEPEDSEEPPQDDADSNTEDEAVADDAAQAEASSEAGEESVTQQSQPRRGARRSEVLERYKDARRRRARLLRNYKIQEVIKRRQILLIQVVKEERGTKGAALTTYMSLAGRYCVLMPNTARGGGISRKIPVAADRKRLRRVVDSLDVPQGMGLIIRTAGAKRTKAEVKRDYDYLIRLWENIRALTLNSIAPCLIHEEANLIKRAIRDLYDKDIDQITVEGDEGYREAKDFMKMLMPSHAKNVQPYKDRVPLLLKFGVENQLDSMYQPMVRLKSGGYLVIHQTEALVAIDVNSGKATRERNIELTALKTNLEAAKEAARQCRLRDLAGLIVIDFIDMEENKNNRSVEKRLKDALKGDRARIQVGRISNFGLLEMSRQRRRSGIVDGTTNACPACGGAGVIRSDEMAALRILRAIESEALAGRSAVICVRASLDVTLYILNHKREWLKRIEDDHTLTIEIVADSAKVGDQYDIEKRGAPREPVEADAAAPAPQPAPEPEESSDEPSADSEEETADRTEQAADSEGGRKRRRRRRKRRDEPAGAERDSVAAEDEEGEPAPRQAESAGGEASSEDGPRKRRRRGRRGGRRNNRRGEEAGADAVHADAEQPSYADDSDDAVAEVADRAPEPIAAPAEMRDAGDSAEMENPPQFAEPRMNGHKSEPEASAGQSASPDEPREPKQSERPPERKDPKSARKGWWQRAIGG